MVNSQITILSNAHSKASETEYKYAQAHRTYNPDVVNTAEHSSSQLGSEGVPHPVLNLGRVLVL
jgi:hypothetical protein